MDETKIEPANREANRKANREDTNKQIELILSRAMALRDQGDLRELIYLRHSIQRVEQAIDQIELKLVCGI